MTADSIYRSAGYSITLVQVLATLREEDFIQQKLVPFGSISVSQYPSTARAVFQKNSPIARSAGV